MKVAYRTTERGCIVYEYMTKSRGPRTEPWGTSQRQVCIGRRNYGE